MSDRRGRGHCAVREVERIATPGKVTAGQRTAGLPVPFPPSPLPLGVAHRPARDLRRGKHARYIDRNGPPLNADRPSITTSSLAAIINPVTPAADAVPNRADAAIFRNDRPSAPEDVTKSAADAQKSRADVTFSPADVTKSRAKVTFSSAHVTTSRVDETMSPADVTKT